MRPSSSATGGRRALAASIALVVCTATPVLAGASRHAAGARAQLPAASGIPFGAPPAAYRTEPTLPTPQGWPFRDAFPRTSGTGRLQSGALEWSDFLYDDHGATGEALTGNTGVGGSASAGTYAYPDGAAHRNGADLFRIGIGKTAKASFWRVDWSTLADRRVPIAEFALDTDANPQTGVSAWAAGAGVTSPGIDQAIVVSGTGAWLVQLASGRTTSLPAPVVDMKARSFVLTIPRQLLATTGTWTVRVAAGLADSTERSFAAPAGGALSGEPNVFNVGFRSLEQEAPSGNYWFEKAQAAALQTGDVSAFSQRVSWSVLADRRSTPEPQPTGISARWYVSTLDLGPGEVPDSASIQDFRPNFLGRVQPYTVYIPTHYRSGEPASVTWILHSLGFAYTQYTAGPASYLEKACEQRYSICVMPEGRGPDMYWYDEAQLDLWQVWHALATAYRLDPTATVVTGFSMGGCGSYSWPLAYPTVFAETVPMAGITANKAYRFLLPDVLYPGSPEVQASGFSTRYESNGDQDPLLENARWMRIYMAQGGRDELVPVSQTIELSLELEKLGQQYRLQIHPAEGHTDWAEKGDYGAVAENIGDPHVISDPGHVTYSWYPAWDHPSWGLVHTGAYWVESPQATTSKDGTLAAIDATSYANPDPAVTPVVSTSALASTEPSPAVVREQTWLIGAKPARRPAIDVHTNAFVSGFAIDLPRAGFRAGDEPTISVVAGRALRLSLLLATTNGIIFVDGKRIGAIPAGSSRTLSLPVGRHTVKVIKG